MTIWTGTARHPGQGRPRPARLQPACGTGLLIAGLLTTASGSRAADLDPQTAQSGTDFVAPAMFCDFMTLTICGQGRVLTASAGFADGPASLWGTHVGDGPAAQAYLMSSRYLPQPFSVLGGGYSTLDGHTGWSWATAGTIIPAEFAWLSRFGDEQLDGRYKIGFNWDTSRYLDNYFDIGGMALAISRPPEKLHEGGGQLWITANQMLERHGPNPDDGLCALITYARDQPETALFRNFVWAGLLDRGFWAGRPDDQLSLGVTYYDVSPRLNATQRLEAQLIESLVGGPRAFEARATVLEANYGIAPWHGLRLQPELEYFLRSGAMDVPNGFLVGLKVHMDF
jgi:porin